MVTVIHGDDSSSSRNFLNRLNLNFQRYDATSGNIDEIRQLLDGNSLFEFSPNILVENLFSKKAKNQDEIIKLINKSMGDIYIYESKEISNNLKFFPKAKSEYFTFPKTLFVFLDSIWPGNSKSLSLFNEALNSNELEILVFMIIKNLRMMIALSLNTEIEETKRLQDWQRGKLMNQASKFGIEKLKKTYKEIFEIDLASKSGGLKLPLKETIDIWLINL